jgi:hypothetical protein
VDHLVYQRPCLMKAKAGEIIAEYLEPGPRNSEVTVNRLIQALDNVRLAEALERLEKQEKLYGPKKRWGTI